MRILVPIATQECIGSGSAHGGRASGKPSELHNGMPWVVGVSEKVYYDFWEICLLHHSDLV